jgi:hypothetical protein
MTGGRLTKIHLIVLSVDQNFHNQLTKIFETFHLIEIFNNEFDQTPKN